jgi:uncharacterized protein YpuA (DUF1002 family)
MFTEKDRQRNNEAMDELESQALDIAERITDSDDYSVLQDILEEFDITITGDQAESLISRCHSVVTEEIYKFAKEHRR